MKKILTILTTLLVLCFITAGLYVFGIPPFQAGGPFYPAAQQQSTQQIDQPLPDFLNEEKVNRAKTYDEHMSRGALLETNKFYTLAIAEYQQANQLAPTNAEPFIKIGRVHLLLNDYPKAQVNFEQALKLVPGNADVEVYLGRSLLQQRKIDEARNIFNKITAESQTVKYYQGILAAYFGDYQNSKKLLTRAIELGGSQDISKKAQNYLGAFSEFDFNQSGQAAHLKTLLGRSYAQTGEYQMAIPLLFEVIKDAKDYRDAWIILGYSYINIGRYQEAIEALDQAKRLDPQKAETFFYLGLAYYSQNNLQQAAKNLEQAKNLGFQPVIQIDQKLAEIYLELKQYDKSAQEYENVVALNDENINYYIRPMWIYLEKLNQPSKAVTLAEKAFRSHPNQPMSFNLIGWAQVGNNQLEDAEKNLQKALTLDPQLDAAYLNLGSLWEKRGQFDKALGYYGKANQMGKGNPIGNAAAEKYNILIARVKNSNTNGNTGTANLFGQ